MLIRIPPRAETYIAFQRTAYQSPLKRLLRPLHLGRFYDRHLLRWVEPLRAGRIQALYSLDLQRELEALRPHLPARAVNVLDIGCGLGGIDALVYEACGEPDLYLVDREGFSDIFYGFEPSAAHYNALAKTRELLLMNGVAAERIHTIDVDSQPLPTDVRFDLVLSLLSWGFHYPLSAYLDYVTRRLTDGGTVILDVRNGTNGTDVLRARFAEVAVIGQTPKGQRVRASRRGRSE